MKQIAYVYPTPGGAVVGSACDGASIGDEPLGKFFTDHKTDAVAFFRDEDGRKRLIELLSAIVPI